MIKISNIDFSYGRGSKVFDNLNLDLNKGHIYGLLGRNGMGKSTILKLISGMIFPQTGTVETMGVDPSKRLPSMMTQLYYVPEEIYTPSVNMTKFVKHNAPFYVNFSHEDLLVYMTEFELSFDKKISSMSLGQKKKAIIAFALACRTPLLIMDEPTNGLDIPSKSQFRKIISGIATDDRCIIISTHQVRDLENLIDTLVVLEGSEIIANASIYDIGKKLMFKAIEPDETAIYSEGNVRGAWGVVENTHNEDSKVDIELFFNAAISQPETIKNILNK